MSELTAVANTRPSFKSFSIREIVQEVHRRNPLLSATGWVHLGLALLALVLMQLDTQIVAGVNAWVKPFKFCISISIYTWTVAWLLDYVEHHRKSRSAISIGIAVSMFAEIFSIAAQAARGTTSHYNIATPLDTALFSLMGNFIAINSVLAVWILVLFFRPGLRLQRVYLWGIRLGLIVFLVGSGVGGQMIANGAHTVGAADGGAGLPLVNWSTTAGDLRIAHGMGLHALQFLPLVGFLIMGLRMSETRQLVLLAIIATAYSAGLLLLFAQAMAGAPLIG